MTVYFSIPITGLCFPLMYASRSPLKLVIIFTNSKESTLFFFPPPLALFFSLPQPTAEFLMTSYFLETERKERNSSWPREGSQTFSRSTKRSYLACSLVPAVLTNPTGAARYFMPGHNSLYRPNPEEIA